MRSTWPVVTLTGWTLTGAGGTSLVRVAPRAAGVRVRAARTVAVRRFRLGGDGVRRCPRPASLRSRRPRTRVSRVRVRVAVLPPVRAEPGAELDAPVPGVSGCPRGLRPCRRVLPRVLTPTRRQSSNLDRRPCRPGVVSACCANDGGQAWRRVPVTWRMIRARRRGVRPDWNGGEHQDGATNPPRAGSRRPHYPTNTPPRKPG